MSVLPCIVWAGYIDRDGYGRIGDDYAHRRAYKRRYGAIPSGTEMHHTCEVKRCVNPEHLVPVTKAQHNALTHEQTHCVHGHPYDEANTYIAPNGKRHCRQCNARRVARYAIKKRQRERQES